MIRRTIIALLLVLFSFGIVYAQDTRQVTLSLDANSEPDLSHYNVYWSTESGTYSNNVSTNGLVTEYSLDIPRDNQIYYFVVAAVDTAGLESDYSNEVNTSRPKAITIRLKAVVTIEVN